MERLKGVIKQISKSREELVNFFSDKWLCANDLSGFGLADTTGS